MKCISTTDETSDWRFIGRLRKWFGTCALGYLVMRSAAFLPVDAAAEELHLRADTGIDFRKPIGWQMESGK